MSQPQAISTLDRPAADVNRTIATLTAEERVAWVLAHLPGPQVLSSSFGAQSAVMLHLITRQQPDIPVIVVDTGYLFPETHDFIDQLTKRLNLNLVIVYPEVSPAVLEKRYGKLWEKGEAGLDQYNQLVKVEPMRQTLERLQANVWYAGLRRSQSHSRENIDYAGFKHNRWKIHPLADWSDRDIGRYLDHFDLPYHPLWHEGYVSIGDIHTTRKLEPGMTEEETRFFGIKRECGLHTEL